MSKTPRPGYAAGNLLNMLLHLGADLTGYDFSGLSVWQAHLRDVNLYAVNLTNAWLDSSVFCEKPGTFLQVAFSPDGNVLAANIRYDGPGEIRLWQVTDMIQIGTLTAKRGFTSLAFSPDSATLAGGCYDGEIRLWDSRSGQLIGSFQEPPDAHSQVAHVVSLAFSPDGRLLASGGLRNVCIWDVVTGICQHTLIGHTDVVESIAFHPTGNILASSSHDTTVRLWHLTTGEVQHVLQENASALLCKVVFSPGGNYLAGSGWNTTMLWDVATGQCVKHYTSGEAKALAFARDGTMLAIGQMDAIQIWDIDTDQCVKTLPHPDMAGIAALAISPDDRLLISTCPANLLMWVWDLQTGQSQTILRGYSNQVWSVACHPDGRLIASGGFDGAVRVWEATSGRCLTTLRGHMNFVRSVRFSSDGALLVSAAQDGTVRIWDTATWTCRRVLRGHSRWGPWSVAISPDNRTIASGGTHDATTCLWDGHIGVLIHTLTGYNGWMHSLAFHPAGSLLAGASGEQCVHIWDVESGEQLQALSQGEERLTTVIFSPDGHYLATASRAETVLLWDTNTWECIETLPGEASGITTPLAFSPDSRLLVMSNHRQFQVWDVPQRQCIRSIDTQASRPWDIALASDGATLISGHNDETIKLWNIHTGDLLQTLHVPRPYEGMNITSATGLTDAQRETLKALGAVEEG